MDFDNSFEVSVGSDEAWNLLLDVPRIARCVPGAELTQVIDKNTYVGRIAVRLGPVTLSFGGEVKFEKIDNEKKIATIKASGNEGKGRGAAGALSTLTVKPSPKGATVFIHTALTLSGAIAQYGRSSAMMQATSAALIDQFSKNLEMQIEELSAAQGTKKTDNVNSKKTASPISAIPFFFKVIANAIRNKFFNPS